MAVAVGVEVCAGAAVVAPACVDAGCVSVGVWYSFTSSVPQAHIAADRIKNKKGNRFDIYSS